MSLQFSTTLRNALLDQIETTMGTAAKVYVRTGSAPANCGSADSGTLLVEFDLGSDYMGNASAGAKSFSSTPISATAVATGTAAHFRIKDSGGTTCHIQGTVTATGGGGDIEIDNTSITNGQTVQITSWSITAPGA